MKSPTFIEGVAVALGASVLGSLCYSILTSTLGSGGVLRLLVAASALGYLIYLFRRCPERNGRVTVVTAWTIVSAVLWFAQPSLLFYLLVHSGMIWLIRSLYFYSSVLASLTDLGLSGLALLAGAWAAINTGSLFLSLWCFFLVQALFAWIPPSLSEVSGQHRSNAAPKDSFQQAYRSAETALRKLASTRQHSQE